MTLKQGLSDHFRHRRDRRLRAVLEQCPRRSAALTILDVGGRASYWERLGLDYLAAIGAEITLLNMTADETELGQDSAQATMFTRAVGNGCALDYPDDHFDLCHSNSVIEHVGLWRDMVAFANETRRVARSYYVQTPNYAFPVDPHFWRMPFFHWLPRPVRGALVRAMPLAAGGRATDVAHACVMVDSSRLLTKGQLRALFPEAELHAERVLLLAKSYTAIALAPSRAPPAEASAHHA